MASVVSNNIDNDIILALQSALANATINGLPGFLAGKASFRDVPIMGSRDEVDDRQFVGTPIAAVVYTTTETHNIPDLTVGCVLHADIMVAVKAESSEHRGRDLSSRINAARNALFSDIPSDANGFGEDGDGDYHPRIRIGTPERDENMKDPWAIAWLPVEVAYRTATRTTH